MKQLTCLWALLCLLHNGTSQAQSRYKPLQVGDTMPPLTISNLINHPVSEIHLSDLKGKLIILDFWGQYCSACIASFPKMDSLQTKFKNQVQMITISNFQKKEDLLETLAKYKSTENLRLTAALQHKQLAALFPHQLVPHVVWINKEGIVAAVTGADYVTENNILQALKNDVAHWPVKKDVVDFDYRLPLLALGQKELPAPRFLYYSTLTATIAGISAPNSITRDSTRGIAIAQHLNTSLLQLCEIALNHPPDGTITLQVKDSSRFKWNGEGLYADWFRANTYCYALVLPIKLSNTEIKQAIQSDLLRWLDLLGVKISSVKKIEAGKEINTYIITDK